MGKNIQNTSAHQMDIILNEFPGREPNADEIKNLSLNLSRGKVSDKILRVILEYANDQKKTDKMFDAAFHGFDVEMLRRLGRMDGRAFDELLSLKEKDKFMVLANPKLSAAQIYVLKASPLDPQRLRILANPNLSPGYMKAIDQECFAPFEMRLLTAKNYTYATPALFNSLKQSCKLDRAIMIMNAGYSPETTELLLKEAYRLSMYKLRDITKKTEPEVREIIEMM